ncbi:GMC oxidoreductase [Candidatus Neomarinimicrobiota bacterium]
MTHTHTYDFIIIGSGFGGSVSALRLAEKGYHVAVVEQGRRYEPDQFPKSNWNLRKFLWFPRIGLYGIQALTLLKNVFVLHGTGVGGGSLVYANNLLVPPDKVFDDPAWGGTGWRDRLAPFYKTAQKMLGATLSIAISETDRLLKECADEDGRGDTFHVNDVGIFFGEAGVEVPDPYFDGQGPARTGCTLCGSCMTGCRPGAKNTLDKNYLYLAERLGVDIIPETRVTDLESDEAGYLVRTKRTTGMIGRKGLLRARKVVFAAGVLGTVRLLLRSKTAGVLPDLSDQVGNFVRTNSEALVGARAKSRKVDYSEGIAIAAGVYPDEHTHIETVRYGRGHDAMSGLATIMVGGGPPWPRFLRFLGQIILHPLKFIKSLNPFGWAHRTIILLVMQTIDNYLKLSYLRRWWRLGGRSLNSYWATRKPVSNYLPIANEYAKRIGRKINGDTFSVLPEVIFGTSSTAHILGGCTMGHTKDEGAINFTGQLHGYKDLYVVDGSIVPANLGVNPSLTITALAEYVMDQVPEKQA